MKSTCLTFFCFCWAFLVLSQEELPYKDNSTTGHPLWVSEMYAEKPDIEKVISEYTRFYALNTFQKNEHTQYFKRWMHGLKRGTNQSMLSNSEKKWVRESEQNYLARSTKLRNRSISVPSSWHSIGPFDWDHTAPSRGKTPGAAHIYLVRQSQTNPDVLYAGTATGGVWKSIDHGLTWNSTTDQLITTEVYALDIDPFNENIVIANIGGQVWRTIDGGINWNRIGGPTFNVFEHFIKEIKFDPLVADRVYVSTNQGLFRSSYGGDSLGFVIYQETQEIEFHPLSSDTVYAVQRSQTKTEFLKSIDGGLTFEIQPNGWPNPTIGENLRTEISVSLDAPNKVFALVAGVVNGGSGLYGVYVSEDQGENWTFNCCGPSAGGIASITNQNILGDDQQGSSNGGQYYYDLAFAVSSSNADSVFVGGINLWISGNGGSEFVCPSNWDQPQSADYIHADIHDIFFNQLNGEIWVACDGGIFFSSDNGLTYQRRMVGILGTDFNGFGVGFWDGNVMIGGTFHNSTHLKDNDVYNNGWLSTDNTGDGVRGFVNFGDDRTVFSDIDMKTLPGDRNLEIPGQNYLHKPNIGETIGQNSKIAFDPRSYNSWYSGDGAELWKTIDHGESFTLIHDFGQNVADIEVSWANSNYIYVTTFSSLFANKKIYRSVDGGDNWTEITIPQSLLGGSFYIPYDIELDGANPERIWAARLVPIGTINLNGNMVYESNDAGATWQNITSSSLNGEQLTGIVHQKATSGTLYLGTRRAVYYKTDSISDWILYNQDLPVNTFSTKLVPYYKDGMLRNATNRSVWEVAFAEPGGVLAMPAADKLEVDCLTDSIQFMDHSVVRGDGATWLWSFPNGTPTTSTLRNPKVAFNSSGGQTVQLTVSDDFGTNTRTFHDFILVKEECGAETVAGSSIKLTGSPQHVQLPVFNITLDTFSVTAMVRLDGIQNNFTAILMNDGASAGFDFHRSNNTLGYFWPGGNKDWDSGLVVPQNVWTHVGMVVTPDSITMYVNGESSTHVVNTNAATFTSLKVGRFKSNDSRNMEGEIDELVMWSKALTKEEIRLHRHLTKNIEQEQNLIAYYQFNEDSEDVLDQISNFHGVLADGAQKVVSRAPIGGGVSHKIFIGNGGIKDFGLTNVEIEFPTSGLFPQDEVVVSRLNVLPVDIPSGKVALTNGYWVINNYGTSGISNFKSIQLKESGFFSDLMLNAPNMGALYSRDENTDDPNWTLRLDENIILQNSLNGTIDYSDAAGMNDLEQWIAVRDSFPFSESNVTILAPELNNYSKRGGSSALPGIIGSKRGIILPVLSDGEIESLASPTRGGMVFGSDRNTIAYFNGSDWLDVLSIPIQVVNNGTNENLAGFSIGALGNSIRQHAILDLTDGDGYVLPPRLTTSNLRDLDFPILGMFAYYNNTNKLVFFDGAKWIPFKESGSGALINTNSPEGSVVGLAIGTNNKDPNAVLDIVSNNQAMLVPNVDVESILQPSKGLLIFDSSRKTFLVYDGLKWKKLLH